MVHNKTRDMLPSISSTIIHVRYSEHASVQSSPHLTVCEIVMKIRKFSFKKVHFKIMMQSVDPFVHQTCEDRYRLYLQHSQPDVDNCIVKYLIICHSLYNQFGCVSIHLHISIYQYKRYTKKSGIWGYNHETWNTYSFGHCQWMILDMEPHQFHPVDKMTATLFTPLPEKVFLSYLLKNQHHFCIKTSILRFKGQQTFRGRLKVQNIRLINYWKFHTQNSQKHRFL